MDPQQERQQAAYRLLLALHNATGHAVDDLEDAGHGRGGVLTSLATFLDPADLDAHLDAVLTAAGDLRGWLEDGGGPMPTEKLVGELASRLGLARDELWAAVSAHGRPRPVVDELLGAADRVRRWVGPRRGAGYRVASAVASTIEQAALALLALGGVELAAPELRSSSATGVTLAHETDAATTVGPGRHLDLIAERPAEDAR